tara:strand:- start:8 stop:508 length:501 start_codon:yes stop_codon:yes gene_type:complete
MKMSEEVNHAAEVYRLLKDKGLSPDAIGAVMANIDIETGGTYQHSTQQKGGNGYGLFQFDYMKPYYNQWLADNEKVDGKSSQIDFALGSIMGDRPMQVRKNADSGWVQAMNENDRKELKAEMEDPMFATSLAKSFSDLYEKPSKPHMMRRMWSAFTFSPEEYETLE